MGFVQLWCSDISYTVFHAHWRNPIIRTNSTIIPGFFEYMGIAISNIIPFFRWSLHVIPWNLHYPMTIPWLSHDYPHVFDSPLNQKWTRWKLFGHIHIIYIIFIFRNHFYFDPHTSILWKYKMYWIFYWYHVGHPNLRPIWPGSHLRLFSNLMPISLYPTVEFCNAFQRPGDGETRI